MYEFKAKIIYKPSGWVIADAPNSIAFYYRKVVERLTWSKLQPPFYGAHITLINGLYDNKTEHKNWKKFHNQWVTLQYDGRIQKGRDGYYWLNIFGDEKLQEVRTSLDLSPYPLYRYHLTIGHCGETQRLWREKTGEKHA